MFSSLLSLEEELKLVEKNEIEEWIHHIDSLYHLSSQSFDSNTKASDNFRQDFSIKCLQ